MDGSLLNSNKQLPDDFYPVFNQLDEKGILFAAASGRQYFSLLETFKPIANKMLFIAENGALVMYKGKELYSSVIPKSDVKNIITALNKIDNSHIVLCGKKSAYIQEENKQSMHSTSSVSYEKALLEIKKYYHRLEQVPNLLAINDDFIKIAVLNFDGTQEYVYPIASKLFSETHQVVVSAQIWLDFMHINASKGSAIKHLQTVFDFSFQQSMSFGDYYNDVEMLKETYYSYAMNNANNDIKNIARFKAPSNDSQGVTKVIKESILGTG